MEKLNLPMSNIIGITMPGFGTTDRTYNNSLNLMKQIGTTIKEISIKDACIQHFKDIEQDINNYDITYENSQARERTQILMDIANKENAIVIGTGDLSELSLGWCTYAGDQISMYGVNAGVPKTLVKHLVKWYADDNKTNHVEDYINSVTNNQPLKGEKEEQISNTLYDILDTIVSPELLPTDENNKIKQSTEDSVGPYELHDFFLYNMIRFGYSPSKIYMLANIAFENKYEKDIIKKWLQVFYKRFFQNQFKRDATSNSVKIGSISLSPRGDWRMPSDASRNLWTKQVEEI
jgi:NAD+ synthase (glutamine-hydrolysing)